MPKVYHMIRNTHDTVIAYVTNGSINIKTPLKHYVKHSPDGFEWGYSGSGPTELARCILIDFFGGVPHEKLDIAFPSMYKHFRERFIARQSRDTGFSISEAVIKEWVRTHYPNTASSPKRSIKDTSPQSPLLRGRFRKK